LNKNDKWMINDDIFVGRPDTGEAAMSLAYGGEENSLFSGRRDFNTSTPKRLHSLQSPIDATTQL
jgi:hypothetical protein